VLAVRLLRRRGRARRQLVNDTEAQTVARARIAELRRESYDELRARVGQPEDNQSRRRLGYDLPGRRRAVPPKIRRAATFAWTVAVDDGGWRAFVPVTDDVMIAPDGSFVGE
jgi:hypothetical protein